MVQDSPKEPSSIKEGDAELVEFQLAKILASSHFKSAKQMQNFLQYIVRKTLAGKSNTLKQYTIAVEALDFSEDFDSDTNPVVRIKAGRVRQRLEKYYENEGENDALIISMPKGTYAPVFTRKPRAMRLPKVSTTDSRSPKLAVICFSDETQNKESNRLLFQISDVMAKELSRFLFITLVVSIPHADKSNTRFAANDIRDKFNADYMLVFYIQQLPKEQFMLVCRLIDSETEEVLWSESYPIDTNIPFNEQIGIIGNITATVADMQQGLLYHHWGRKLLEDEESIPNYYQTIAYYRYYSDNLGLDAFSKAATLCEQRLAENTDDVISNVVFAEYCRRDFVYGFGVIDDALKKGKACAQRAIRKNPNSPEAHYSLAQILFCLNDWPGSVNELNMAQDISQYHASIEYGVGFHFCLMGRWTEGVAIVNKIMALSSSYPSWYNLPVFLNEYRQKNYDQALVYANKMDTPTIFHGAMARCVSLSQLGEKEKARRELQDLLKIYPIFLEKGKSLLSRFIGSDELVEQLWEGIDKANN